MLSITLFYDKKHSLLELLRHNVYVAGMINIYGQKIHAIINVCMSFALKEWEEYKPERKHLELHFCRSLLHDGGSQPLWRYEMSVIS